MSLAIFAAPVDNDNNDFGDNNHSIHKKKLSKTLKKYHNNQDLIQEKVDFNKVNQVMKAMNNLPNQEQDDELGDFNPPPKPVSAGVQSTIMRENITNINKPNNNNNTSENIITNIPNYENMYNNTTPNYNTMTANYSNLSKDDDALMNKINYMIHLLEEQQDEKSGSVMEEVILYSFLGIFIIFIADTFVKAGKYIR
jgi:hypothetical protein